jgi:hypothetical protein
MGGRINEFLTVEKPLNSFHHCRVLGNDDRAIRYQRHEHIPLLVFELHDPFVHATLADPALPEKNDSDKDQWPILFQEGNRIGKRIGLREE